METTSNEWLNGQAAQNILPRDGTVFLFNEFFSDEEGHILFEKLKDNIQWRQEPIKLFGKQVMQPRLTAWHGDDGTAYSYSGITMQPQPWTADLNFIRARLQKLLGLSFNSALLNYYRNGADSMGWHRDNERSLGKNPTIASVSFGVSRAFVFKHTTEKIPVINIPLHNGSVLIMSGATQHYWLHALNKEKAVDSGRISITFRNIIAAG